MPKRFSKKAKKDENEAAFALIRKLDADSEEPRSKKVVPLQRRKNPAAVALGRKGGQKSAAARLVKIDPAERSRIAAHAARVRWEKEKGDG